MSEVPTAVFFVDFASALEETLHRNIGTDSAQALQSEAMVWSTNLRTSFQLNKDKYKRIQDDHAPKIRFPT